MTFSGMDRNKGEMMTTGDFKMAVWNKLSLYGLILALQSVVIIVLVIEHFFKG